MNDIRVIYIPQLKVVTSGPINSMEELHGFDRWWSAIDMKNYITPRDFMWYNEKKNYMEWVFAVPEGYSETGGYILTEFPGGLYAVGTSKDSEEDSNRVKKLIKEWIINSNNFALSTSFNDPYERYDMCHVITPKIFKEKMGYHLSDNFLPIVVK